MKDQKYIEVLGARENNLKDISVKIPKDKLTVITGVSGSGKSSLAFDTIYAEGQRRYLDTFSSYARQIIGSMEKPDVDAVDGLSPVISIEQKTSGWNPRSTVGTVTEVYDYFRLLFARASEAFSYVTGKKMTKYTDQQILERLLKDYDSRKVMILGPVVRGRKGHYRELLEQYRKMGYTKARIDDEQIDLVKDLKLSRFKVHDIDIVIDRLTIAGDKKSRIKTAVDTALDIGKGLLFVYDYERDETQVFSKELMDSESGVSYEVPSPNSFSFNSPYGYCPTCKGLGNIFKADPEKITPDLQLTVAKGGFAPLGEERENNNFKELRKIAKHFGFTFATPIDLIPQEAIDVVLNGGHPEFLIKRKWTVQDYTFTLAEDGLIGILEGLYEKSSSEKVRTWAADFMSINVCPSCDGSRLKKEALFFKVGDKNIAELSQFNLEELHAWVTSLPKKLNKVQLAIGQEVIKEIHQRLSFLLDVGLNYLTLNRQARTLSGGESQRTRLATQIGSKLTGITYILDEPSIGLHARDNDRLITALKGLTDIGNSVIVVEHDKEIMVAADHIIDLGPGAGVHGGYITTEGHIDSLSTVESDTAKYLLNQKEIEVPVKRRKGNGLFLELKGAEGNNLRSVNLKIPAGTFICVTGVSGSGKSTLIHDTLYPILRQHFYKSIRRPLSYQSIKGIDHFDKVIEINQKPIGRTPRSNPATYTGVFTEIRNLYTKTPESKIRGYKAGRFSFNVKGGRCETCQGGGKRTIEMNFLPDVLIDCETCQGKRYNRETLEILYKGKSIYDVLEMSIDMACEFFEHIPKIYRKLSTIRDVGLGYITLGQPATTLSGGEAQRVKLAEELSKRSTGNTFYILDEPTTGLHFQDIEHLLGVLHKLVHLGNTVLVIEHNMDVIKTADYIFDLGPEGGDGGGEIVAQGTPEKVARSRKSKTAPFLKMELK